jgi:hypothetical protein
MTEMTNQTKLRDVPHAEIQKRWLEDDSLTVEFYDGEKMGGNYSL